MSSVAFWELNTTPEIAMILFVFSHHHHAFTAWTLLDLRAILLMANAAWLFVCGEYYGTVAADSAFRWRIRDSSSHFADYGAPGI